MRKIFHYQRVISHALCIPLNFIYKNNSLALYFAFNLLSNNNLFVSSMLLDKLASKPLKIASEIAKIISLPASNKIELDITIRSQKIVLTQSNILISKIPSIPSQKFLHRNDSYSLNIIFPHVESIIKQEQSRITISNIDRRTPTTNVILLLLMRKPMVNTISQ